MNEKKFIDGMFVERPSNCPDFVKGKISINSKFVEWYNANKNDKGYVNIDLLESKDGKLYAKHNDWKPHSDKGIPVTNEQMPSEDDMPF